MTKLYIIVISYLVQTNPLLEHPWPTKIDVHAMCRADCYLHGDVDDNCVLYCIIHDHTCHYRHTIMHCGGHTIIIYNMYSVYMYIKDTL